MGRLKKHISKHSRRENSQKNPFPTFSLEECLSDLLSCQHMELSTECRERVINLSKSGFVSNPTKMNEGWFVKHFAEDITTTNGSINPDIQRESNKKEMNRHNMTGTCI